MGMTMFCFELSRLSLSLNFSFTFAWLDCLALTSYFAVYGQYGHDWSFGLSSSKRGKLLIPSLCKVLMITNTNVLVHMLCLSCVVETGS